MSAIVGVLRLDGAPVEESVIRGMIASMPHRCPDGLGAWASGPVGLGHGLMHTTPESLGEVQPLRSADGTRAIVAHARLDDREGLRPELEVSLDRPDAEWLFAAYRLWGVGGLNRLVGDFAFAVWDESSGELVLVRDQLGVRPLYYAHLPGRLLAFATEPKALFQLPEVPRVLDEVRIGDYLAGLDADPEPTIYAAVRRLPPGHLLRARGGQVSIERYYSLAPDPCACSLSDEECAARFRTLFVAAVRARMRSAFPIGCQLSGGLDSSAVTAVAAALAPELGVPLPLHAFSLVFPDTAASDERLYIDTMLERTGAVPHIVNGDLQSPLGNIEEVYAGLDDHLVGGTQHLVWALFRAAGEAGVRVSLDGIDGDTVVEHGLLRLTELARAEEWATFSAEVRALTARFHEADHRQDFEWMLSSTNQLVRRFALPELQRLATGGHAFRLARAIAGLHAGLGASRRLLWRIYGPKLLAPLVPAAVRQRRRRRVEGREVPSWPLVDAAFMRRLGLRPRLERLEAARAFRFDQVRDLQHQLLTSPSLTSALEATSHFAALHGVEARHPFMDRRLIEFALGMPSRVSLQQGWTRFVLREALEGYLPEAVRWRVGKADMTPGVEASLRRQDLPTLTEALAPGGPLDGYLAREEADRQLASFEHLTVRERVQLIRAATLSLWMKKLERQGLGLERTSDVAISA